MFAVSRYSPRMRTERVTVSLPAELVADAARGVGIPAEGRDTLGKALAAVRALELVPPPRIVITGSLYLAGEVLAANGTLPE